MMSTKAILKARALALAQEINTSEDPADSIEVIEFEVASEMYALESCFIQEVYPFNNLTPLPCVPDHVMGIINVRGQIWSVIDIKKFFDLADTGVKELNKVILLRSESMSFGILADRVIGMRMVAVGDLQMPSMLTGIRDTYLKGITAERTTLLDANKLLSDIGLVVDEHVNT